MIDYGEVVVTVLNSESREAAAKNLGISKQALSYRLTELKKAGVKFPTPPKKRVLDDLMVAQLNSIIRKYKESK